MKEPGKMTDHAPTLSLGIPVYNGAHYIAEALDSILDQDFRDLEVVISDNCSSDDTAVICRRYAELDGRVRLIRNTTNVGAPRNYNLVFEHSSGRYFKWASASDICGKEFFSRCVAALDSNPGAVLAFAETQLFEHSIADAQPYVKDVPLDAESPHARFRTLLSKVQLNNVMNGVIRRSILARTGLHGEYLSSDVVLMAELALHGTFIQIDGSSFYRRMSAETTAGLRDPERMLDHWAPARKHIPRFQAWHFIAGLYGSVLRARPGFKDTALLLADVSRRVLWNRRTLARELFEPWAFTHSPQKRK